MLVIQKGLEFIGKSITKTPPSNDITYILYTPYAMFFLIEKYVPGDCLSAFAWLQVFVIIS